VNCGPEKRTRYRTVDAWKECLDSAGPSHNDQFPWDIRGSALKFGGDHNNYI
jgi:hypothetical protein